LHDIGSLTACLKLPELARQALLYRPDGAAGAVFSIERAVLRTPDAAIGRELLHQWRLPRILELAVGWHPAPEQAEEQAVAAATVQLALFAAAAQEQALAFGEMADETHPAWQQAGLAPAAAADLAIAAEREFQAALALFEL
jgi:HD-like signal output (HDOD) protein